MMVSEVGLTTRGSAQLGGRRRPHFAVGADFQAMMGDDSAFLGEPFDVSRLLLEIAERNKQRKIGIFVAGGLDHRIQLALDIFPDAVSPWLDHHAASDFRVFRKVGGANDLLIPLGKIFGPSGCDRGFRL